MNKIIFFKIFLTTNFILAKNPSLQIWNNTGSLFHHPNENTTYLIYENLFFLKEMNQKSAGMFFNMNKAGINCRFSKWGNMNYNQNLISTSYIKGISPQLKISIGLQAFQINQLEVSSSPLVLKPNLGLSYKIDESSNVFIAINNQDFLFSKDYYPDLISILWEYKISEIISSLTGFNQTLNQRIWSVGINFTVKSDFDFFFQVENSESPVSCISQFTLKKIDLMISNKFHQKLGISNQLGFAIRW